MTDTKNIICERCGAEEKRDEVARIENHYKNFDHSDKTIPKGYLCMKCGHSNVETSQYLKSI
jgi:uncharacterized Zn finger protein